MRCYLKSVTRKVRTAKDIRLRVEPVLKGGHWVTNSGTLWFRFRGNLGGGCRSGARVFWIRVLFVANHLLPVVLWIIIYEVISIFPLFGMERYGTYPWRKKPGQNDVFIPKMLFTVELIFFSLSIFFIFSVKSSTPWMLQPLEK